MTLPDLIATMVRRVGGPANVARILDVSRTLPYAWIKGTRDIGVGRWELLADAASASGDDRELGRLLIRAAEVARVSPSSAPADQTSHVSRVAAGTDDSTGGSDVP